MSSLGVDLCQLSDDTNIVPLKTAYIAAFLCLWDKDCVAGRRHEHCLIFNEVYIAFEIPSILQKFGHSIPRGMDGKLLFVFS